MTDDFNAEPAGPGPEITGAKKIVRILWRSIPTPLRYWLYKTGTKTARESNHFLFRAFRRVRSWWRIATLYHHRWSAVTLWPDAGARTLDNLALAVWMAAIYYHDVLLNGVWRWGHLFRLRRPCAVDASHQRRVVHVTGSFDLGGTQTQIKFLCTSPDAAYQHQAIEIFPEMNYLYRQGVEIDPRRYVRGGLLGRTFGRMVTNINYRSSQIIQIYKLVCDFRAERPAIAVGWGHEMSVTTFIAAAIARVPRIVFCIRTVNPTYGWVPPVWGRMLLRAHKRMMPNVSLVAVNSTLLRDDHAEWVGMNPAKIAVCANGIDIEPFDAVQAAGARLRVRKELGIPDDAIVIINVGRFSGEKGQHSLIYANRLLLARGIPRKFTWLLCGDGPTMAEVQGIADGYGMTNIKFLGRTTAVRDMLAASDIFVMPSDFEGMPNAMLEGMSAGLPCVSTRRSGALDVARDGLEAFYYEARDAVTLARHLLRLLEDPAAARQRGDAAAARVKEFPIARFVRAFESALDTVLATAGPNQS
jgi:glycosyltransferase involved in cell wall biosynthesis